MTPKGRPYSATSSTSRASRAVKSIRAGKYLRIEVEADGRRGGASAREEDVRRTEDLQPRRSLADAWKWGESPIEGRRRKVSRQQLRPRCRRRR